MLNSPSNSLLSSIATLLEPGKTFAQTVRTARLAVRIAAPNNPIWLAYSGYAHPNARIIQF